MDERKKTFQQVSTLILMVFSDLTWYWKPANEEASTGYIVSSFKRTFQPISSRQGTKFVMFRRGGYEMSPVLNLTDFLGIILPHEGYEEKELRQLESWWSTGMQSLQQVIHWIRNP